MSGLYVHIPFCVSKCAYCDFISFSDHSLVDAYIAALVKEASMRRAAFDAVSFDTVFIGGGTPSILAQGSIAQIIGGLRANFSIISNAEITIEANPGTLTREKLNEYIDSGINRLSIGLQSADGDILKRIGRVHSLKHFEESLSAALACGMSNINADIMYGLPGQDMERWIRTLEYICAKDITHISAYSLILEKGTPLYNDFLLDGALLPSPDEAADMQNECVVYLASKGYERYEVSNFSKPNFQCRHNLNYWDNQGYLGLGLAAHSAFDIGVWSRWENTASLNKYIKLVGDGLLPVERVDHIPQREEMFECVMLGLRKTSGLKPSAFKKRFNAEFMEVYAKAVSKLSRAGLLIADADEIKPTKRGMDILNTVLLEFMC